MNPRQIIQMFDSQPSSDGDGVQIRRTLGQRRTELDPFLMLDEIHSDKREDYIGGFPPHPHRGIETLTYMIAGGFVHEDNQGNRAELHNGGAQWMSAGRGVIHSEMPLIHEGGLNDGLLHGFQLWINLPAAQKMGTPRYRQAEAREIPVVALSGGGSARVVAGQWLLEGQTVSSPLDGLACHARALDVQLPPGATLSLTLPAQDTLLAYVYEGRLATLPAVQRGQLARFGSGDSLALPASDSGARLLLLAGTPLNEAIAHYGPFVMNSEAEIRQAIDDYRNGRFGQAL